MYSKKDKQLNSHHNITSNFNINFCNQAPRLNFLKYQFILTVCLISFQVACGSQTTQIKAVPSTLEHEKHLPSAVKNNKNDQTLSVSKIDKSKPYSDIPCVQEQKILYKKGTKAIYEFIRGFLGEIPKYRGRFGYDPRNQSQIMIYFGENFISRIALLEKLASCDPLFEEYLIERSKMAREVNELMKAYNISK